MSGLFDHEQISEIDVPAVPLPKRDPAGTPEVERQEPMPAPVPAPEAGSSEGVDATASEAVEAPPSTDAVDTPPEHAGGSFDVPDGYTVIEGAAEGGDGRAVGVVVSRFNAEITSAMLDEALGELERFGIERSAVTVVPVPGAFELPLGAMALAKTRRFACIVALGCVIRGETAHFEYVAGEAASGLQLAAIETGVPVAFGVLTTEDRAQAEARVGRAADAVRSALEMASLFSRLRARSPAPAAG